MEEQIDDAQAKIKEIDDQFKEQNNTILELVSKDKALIIPHYDASYKEVVSGFSMFGMFAGVDLDSSFEDLQRTLESNLESLFKAFLGNPIINLLDPVRFFNARFFISSPIILDLDGDGVETVGVEEDGSVFFDFNGDGRQSLTGWVGKDDGLLVFDRNGDGIINDGSELFGNNTARYNGLGKCIHGFEALAQEDSNGDGLVNHLDDNWQHLNSAWL